MMDIQQSFDDLNQRIKNMQTEVERLKKERDAFYTASSVSDQATVYLDHAESMLQLLIDSYFNGESAEDFNRKWGIEYAYKTIQNALYAIQGEINQANALAYAGMGYEHGQLYGMKITVKEMDDAIHKLKEIQS